MALTFDIKNALLKMVLSVLCLHASRTLARLLLSHHEARMKSLQESMKEAENKKRSLEECVDALREECAKLKAAEQVTAVSSKEKAEEKEKANEVKVALEQQMDQLRDVHQKQVAELQTQNGALNETVRLQKAQISQLQVQTSASFPSLGSTSFSLLDS